MMERLSSLELKLEARQKLQVRAGSTAVYQAQPPTAGGGTTCRYLPAGLHHLSAGLQKRHAGVEEHLVLQAG